MPIGKLSWRGRAPVDAKNWRSKLLAEVGRELDPARVHFVGKLPYADYLSLLQVSTVHVFSPIPSCFPGRFLKPWRPAVYWSLRARRRLKR